MSCMPSQTCVVASGDLNHSTWNSVAVPPWSNLHTADIEAAKPRPLNPNAPSFYPTYHTIPLSQGIRPSFPDDVYANLGSLHFGTSASELSSRLSKIIDPFAKAPFAVDKLPVNENCILPDRSERLVECIEQWQDSLRDTRDELMGTRFRLRTKRKFNTALRQCTISKIGAAIDLAQRFVLTKGLELPENIWAACREANALRDELGTEEAEYEEAEHKYDLQEWKYTEKEKKFLDDLSTDHLLPATTTEFHHPLRNLGPEPFQKRDKIDSSLDLSHATHMNKIECPIVPSNSVGLAPPYELPPVPSYFDTSIQDLEHIRQAVRLETELKIEDAHLNWTNTRNRIETWLRDTVAASSLQVHRLRSLQPQTDLNFMSWWQLVDSTWISIDSNEGQFHTGATTGSGSTVLRPPSIKRKFSEDHLQDDLHGHDEYVLDVSSVDDFYQFSTTATYEPTFRIHEAADHDVDSPSHETRSLCLSCSSLSDYEPSIPSVPLDHSDGSLAYIGRGITFSNTNLTAPRRERSVNVHSAQTDQRKGSDLEEILLLLGKERKNSWIITAELLQRRQRSSTIKPADNRLPDRNDSLPSLQGPCDKDLTETIDDSASEECEMDPAAKDLKIASPMSASTTNGPPVQGEYIANAGDITESVNDGSIEVTKRQAFAQHTKSADRSGSPDTCRSENTKSFRLPLSIIK